MAVISKSPDQITHLRDAGRIVAETYEVLRPYVVPGVTTGELDRIAEQFIRKQGAFPTYKGYGAIRDRRGKLTRPPFPATICVAINDVICHGIPSAKDVLQDGDIIGIDIGASYKGWIGDSCVTFPVGSIDAQSQRLLDVTRRSLELGLEQSRPGKRLGDIGAVIQRYAEGEGFSVVRELGGHGVGRTLHEDPFLVHVGLPGTGLKMEPGMAITFGPT